MGAAKSRDKLCGPTRLDDPAGMRVVRVDILDEDCRTRRARSNDEVRANIPASAFMCQFLGGESPNHTDLWAGQARAARPEHPLIDSKRGCGSDEPGPGKRNQEHAETPAEPGSQDRAIGNGDGGDDDRREDQQARARPQPLPVGRDLAVLAFLPTLHDHSLSGAAAGIVRAMPPEPRRKGPERKTIPPERATMPVRSAGAPNPGDVVPSHYRWCLGCGVDHPGGLHLRVIAGDGLDMSSTLDVSKYHQGAPGLAHGGMIAAAMDEAMGVLNRHLGVPAVTVHLEVDYRRPVPVGTTLHISTRIAGAVGRKIYTEGEARLNAADGDVAVTAAALFLQVPLEHFLDNGNPEQIAAAIEDRRQGGPSWVHEVNP